MTIYRIRPGSQPVQVQLDGPDGPVTELILGEAGRGRVDVRIPLVGCGPVVRPKRTDTGQVVLVRGEWVDDGRCLAVINTVGGYDRYRSYALFDPVNLEVLAEGSLAFGDAGRAGGGPEVLALCRVGASFRLNGKYRSWWYAWTGTEWVVRTPEQRAAEAARRAVEAGGGEWL
jgi:hypothetical protein